MKTKFQTGRAALVLISALSAVLAHADDINPPSWRLSDPSATVQEWDFKSSALPLAPDGNIWGSGGGGFINPFGTPTLSGATTASWVPTLGGRSGVYVMGGGSPSMEFEIPNDPSGHGFKEMWIQVSHTNSSGALFEPDVFVASSAFTGFATSLGSTFMSDGWTHTTYSVMMQGCPNFERVSILNNSPVGIAVDQVVMDTICIVPEPASMTALAIGLVGLLRRRKK